MRPTLLEGDLLLVAYDACPRAGQIVVVRLPGGVVAVKRATVRLPTGWWIERDNPSEGVDSARVGEIQPGDVLAVARLRIWPRPRVLRVRSTPTR